MISWSSENERFRLPPRLLDEKSVKAEDASDHKKMERKPEDLSNDWISILNNENAHDSNRKKKEKEE